MAVTSKAIRVQLPAGNMYAPALLQAATRTGDRSALSSGKRTALKQLVNAAITLLNSASAERITLEMTLDDDSIDVSLVGTACSRADKKLVAALASLADKKAQSFTDDRAKASRTIRFRI